MNKLKTWFNLGLKTLKQSIDRFPEALIFAYAFGVVSVLLVHADYNAHTYRETLEKLLLVFSLGVPLMLVAKMTHEKWLKSLRDRLLLIGLGLVALVAFYFTIPENMNDVFIFRVFVVNVSLYLAFTLIPFYKSQASYPLYSLKLVSDAAITFLFTIVMFAGLSAIYFAVENLLDISLFDDIYQDTFLVLATMFAPTYFLGGLLRSSEDIKDFMYSRVFKILFAYIVMPILTVYTGILYLYFVKLIFDGGLPENMIGNLVIWYSAITLVVLFFTQPVKEVTAFSKAFHRFMPYAILLPLAMMFVAIGIRIDGYGLTVKRYFVVALGVWVTGNMIYLILSKKRLTQVIVLSAIVVMLLSMYGPVGAYPMSRWHQNMRFENQLKDLNMLKGNDILARTDLSQTDQDKINALVQYFEYEHSITDIKLLGDDFDLDQFTETFGFSYESYVGWREMNRYVHYWLDQRAMTLPLKGYDTLVVLEWYGGLSDNPYSIKTQDGGDVSLTVNDKQVLVPLSEWVAQRETTDKGSDLSPQEAQFAFSHGGQDHLLVVRNLSGEFTPSGTFKLTQIEAYLLMP